MDKYFILSKSDWGDLFDNRKAKGSAYLCIFIGYILCLVNDSAELFRGQFTIRAIYGLIIFCILTALLLGIYYKKYYVMPFSILAFSTAYLITNIIETFLYRNPIEYLTICYSVMYFIVNSLFFRLRFVLYINLILFFAVAACSVESLLAPDIAGQGPPRAQMLNAIVLSAAGFLLQHAVLTVRAMLIEQMGAIKIKVAALEAQMEIENARKEARDKTLRLNRISIVEALGASIAHEINQPIAAALTYCQALRNWAALECQDATETLGALGGVEANVGRAARLIDHIRLLTTNKDREYALADVRVLVQDQINLISAEYDRRGIKLSLKRSATDMMAVICAPEVALATLNILRNAMEAFDEPIGDAAVTVHCRRSGSAWIEIVVVDNGKGLSSEGIQMAFGAFHTTKDSGAGIGLSICQEVAEHHSGSMSLAANPGRGLTATLRLAANRSQP